MNDNKHSKQEVGIGSEEWFIQEAWRSLRKEDGGRWDFSNSALIYSKAGIAAYKKLQSENTRYATQVTSEECQLFQGVAQDVIHDVPNEFAYLDLGPGTEHKEKYFFDAAKNVGKSFEYFPIDISKTVLDEAQRFAQERGIKTYAILGCFEDIAHEELEKTSPYRFVSLGATFANYDTNKIIQLLLNLARDEGSAMFTAQLRDRVNIEEVKKAYQEQAMLEVFEAKLKLLGLTREDIDRFEASDEIIVSVVIKTPTEKLKSLGMKSGDRLDVLKSFRLTERELKHALRNTNFQIYDIGKTFVVVHMKQKHSANF